MKNFISRFILFISILLIIIIVLEKLFKSIPNDYSYKNNYILKNTSTIEILILGSSHAYRDVNPSVFNKPAFNFAMVSQTLDYDFFILSKYMDDIPNLKYVILPISYFSFSQKLEDGTEKWRKYKYIYYLGFNNISLKDRLSIKTYFGLGLTTGKDAIKNIYDYYLKGKDNINCDTYGWGKWNNEKQVDLVASAKKAASRHDIGEININNIQYLNQIVDLCSQNNIKLILFTPPASSYYIENLNNDKLGQIVTMCKNTTNENNIRYYNFLNDSVFVDSLFKDGDHLNTNGANLLSNKLNQLLSF